MTSPSCSLSTARRCVTASSSVAWLTVVVCLLAAPAAAARQAPARSAQGPGADRPGRAAVTADNAGFDPIFDGKALRGGDGDAAIWGVDEGAIVGKPTAEKPLNANTFIVWRGGTTKDFELKLEYRISPTTPAGNSGVQFRSSLLPD